MKRFTQLLVLSMPIVLLNLACGSRPTVVLVHGAFQDAKATWTQVQPALEHDGFKVITVDLPGRDGDGVDPHGLTMDAYRDAVLAKIEAEKEPVVLAGHSFGGLTISNVAEAAPKKIKTLIYLAAYLPQNGDSLQSLAAQDTGSGLNQPGNFVVASDYSTASVADGAKGMLFGNDAADANQQKAIADSLIPEPLAPMAITLSLTGGYASVPKAYLKTAKDQVVSPAFQDQMLSHTTAERVLTLDSGHAPYVTHVSQLVADLEQLADER